MAKQAQNTGTNWYVIHTYSGYEDAVRTALLQRIESMNMMDKIFDVIVPKETQIVVKNGKPKTEKKRLFPGYVIVNMIVDDESWYVVRNTPNVTGFVGSGTIPVPVSAEEFGVIQRYLDEDSNQAKFKISLNKSDLVMILDGPFATYEGVVNEIDEEKGKVKIMISIFGRETPVELDFDQVKKK
ncbi:MAG: transcriptional antiterminator NusG [Oceanicoccus sp.]|jgi:transcriptional antiterminator NusG